MPKKNEILSNKELMQRIEQLQKTNDKLYALLGLAFVEGAEYCMHTYGKIKEEHTNKTTSLTLEIIENKKEIKNCYHILWRRNNGK